MTTLKDLVFDGPRSLADLATGLVDDDHVLLEDGVDPLLVAMAVLSALDTPAGDVLTAGWATSPAVRRAVQCTREAAGARRPVIIGPHSLHCRQPITVDVLHRGEPTSQVDLILTLDVWVPYSEVMVKDGSVQAVGTGLGRATAKLSLGDTVLLERTTDQVRVPYRSELDISSSRHYAMAG